MAQATTGTPRTSVRHPLAPLTVGEAGQASRLALAAVGPGARLVYCALAEPAKRAVLAWDGHAAAPGGPLRPVRTGRRADLGDHGLARRSRGDQEGPGPRRPAAAHDRGVDREQPADQGRSRLPGRAGPARYHGHVPGPGRSLAGQQLRAGGGRLRPAPGAGGGLPARRPGQQPVRPADREPGGAAGPRHRGGTGDRGRRGGAHPPGHRPVRRRQRGRTAPAVGAADRAARRARVHRGRRVPDLGTLADAAVAAPDRGTGAAPDRLPRPRAACGPSSTGPACPR